MYYGTGRFSGRRHLIDPYGRRSLRDNLDDVDAELAGAQDALRAMRSSLAQGQAALQQRVDRLEQVIGAVVALSDVRAELAVFEAENAVRRAAARLLRELAGPAAAAAGAGRPWRADLPECPGFWLAPALAWLRAVLDGQQPQQGGQLLEAARQADPVRCAVFVTACLGLAGQGEFGSAMLSAALGQPGQQVTRAQRALWLGCADGRYGGAGQDFIRAWLAGYAQGAGAGAQEQWVTAVAGSLRGAAAGGLSFSPAGGQDLAGPVIAAEQLRALRSRAHEALAGAGGAAGAAGAAELAAVAAQVAQDPTEDEAGSWQRARELRAVIEGQEPAAGPAWDAPAGVTLELLCADAAGPDLALRRIALGSCAAWAAGLADTLAARAAVEPPQQVPLRVGSRVIMLESSGRTPLGAAYAEIERSHEPHTIGDRMHRKELAADAARERADLDAAVGSATGALLQQLAAMRDAAAQAAGDHEAVRADLAAMSGQV